MAPIRRFPASYHPLWVELQHACRFPSNDKGLAVQNASRKTALPDGGKTNDEGSAVQMRAERRRGSKPFVTLGVHCSVRPYPYADNKIALVRFSNHRRRRGRQVNAIPRR